MAEIYSDLQFIIDDIFHCEKHTQSKCVLTHSDCQYHPHLSKLAHVRSMNTAVAEQSFNRINPFKYTTRKMSYCRRLLFLKFLDDNWNNRASKKINNQIKNMLRLIFARKGTLIHERTLFFIYYYSLLLLLFIYLFIDAKIHYTAKN